MAAGGGSRKMNISYQHLDFLLSQIDARCTVPFYGVPGITELTECYFITDKVYWGKIDI